jgi:hypothetical protein
MSRLVTVRFAAARLRVPEHVVAAWQLGDMLTAEWVEEQRAQLIARSMTQHPSHHRKTP